jgi:hypothetical protein
LPPAATGGQLLITPGMQLGYARVEFPALSDSPVARLPAGLRGFLLPVAQASACPERSAFLRPRASPRSKGLSPRFPIFHFLIPILPPLNSLRRGGFRPPSSSSSSRFCEGGARPALLGHSHLRTSPNPAPCHPEPACPERISRRAPFAGEGSTFPSFFSANSALSAPSARLLGLLARAIFPANISSSILPSPSPKNTATFRNFRPCIPHQTAVASFFAHTDTLACVLIQESPRSLSLATKEFSCL